MDLLHWVEVGCGVLATLVGTIWHAAVTLTKLRVDVQYQLLRLDAIADKLDTLAREGVQLREEFSSFRVFHEPERPTHRGRP